MRTRRRYVPVQTPADSSCAFANGRDHRFAHHLNPDTSQVETVKVDEMSRALCLLDAFHLTFTYGKPLWMLEPASVTTAQAQTCISRLGRRISLEWWMWWLQQQCGQQQRGQLFGVLLMVRVVAAVLVRAIREGSEAAERSICGLVHVGELLLAACDPCVVQWVVCVTRCMVQDAWQLCACVSAEIRTYICGSGSGVAAVAIAVDREASDASRVPQMARGIMTYACEPYV